MALHSRLSRLAPIAVTLAAVAGLFGTVAVTSTGAPTAPPHRTAPPGPAPGAPDDRPYPHAKRATPHDTAAPGAPGARWGHAQGAP